MHVLHILHILYAAFDAVLAELLLMADADARAAVGLRHVGPRERRQLDDEDAQADVVEVDQDGDGLDEHLADGERRKRSRVVDLLRRRILTLIIISSINTKVFLERF